MNTKKKRSFRPLGVVGDVLLAVILAGDIVVSAVTTDIVTLRVYALFGSFLALLWFVVFLYLRSHLNKLITLFGRHVDVVSGFFEQLKVIMEDEPKTTSVSVPNKPQKAKSVSTPTGRKRGRPRKTPLV